MKINVWSYEEEYKSIRKQILKVKKELERYITNKVDFINIDGQSRSKCAVIPYINGEFNLKDDELRDLYNTVEKWGAALINELDARDALVDNRPSTNILVAVTVTQLQNLRRNYFQRGCYNHNHT